MLDQEEDAIAMLRHEGADRLCMAEVESENRWEEEATEQAIEAKAFAGEEVVLLEEEVAAAHGNAKFCQKEELAARREA